MEGANDEKADIHTDRCDIGFDDGRLVASARPRESGQQTLQSLVDQRAKFTYPDGKSEETSAKAGEAKWTPAGAHEPENVGDKPLEVVLVELKGKAEKK